MLISFVHSSHLPKSPSELPYFPWSLRISYHHTRGEFMRVVGWKRCQERARAISDFNFLGKPSLINFLKRTMNYSLLTSKLHQHHNFVLDLSLRVSWGVKEHGVPHLSKSTYRHVVLPQITTPRILKTTRLASSSQTQVTAHYFTDWVSHQGVSKIFWPHYRWQILVESRTCSN